jgi:PTH1 family peptidyl-tRNA hydrolase
LGGSSKGHNGLKSLILSLNTDEFARVRIGIGRPESKESQVVAKYVLEEFGEQEIRGI